MNALTLLTKTLVLHEVGVGHNLEKYVEFSIVITTMLIHAKEESSKSFNNSSHPLIPH
jgi:hypothetical protein